VVGPATNVAFLRRLMRCDAFAGADLDTGLIERERAALLPAARDPEPGVLAQAAAAVLMLERAADAATRCRIPGPHVPAGEAARGCLAPSCSVAGSTNGRYRSTTRRTDSPRTWATYRSAWPICAGRRRASCARAGRRRSVRHRRHAARRDAAPVHRARRSALGYVPALAHVGEDVDSGGGVTAPMPGKVVAILCEAGKRVERGTPLVVMEAMKMEHTINAPSAGTVTELLFAIGDQVPEGAALLAFSPA
jgi:3-methylcrotonyl-CoA carboxylase alpha subunit